MVPGGPNVIEAPRLGGLEGPAKTERRPWHRVDGRAVPGLTALGTTDRGAAIELMPWKSQSPNAISRCGLVFLLGAADGVGAL
jgi:hypothetical protein